MTDIRPGCLEAALAGSSGALMPVLVLLLLVLLLWLVLLQR
jgi:hypothetical protein